ncbi:MraY family glycosyltransferase [Solicola gregarius]|uniref:Undecaprenyl/decaprenyl-phosphate alpha-N-acetylglucosaminyl 1-phosphate transferase n=1 Tax=Solicola gregarius TaxID=2908642 RepID=A0AA46TIM8_9ACTN|nr:MraY family glycosyltransferase [Solicola gregarius]UYM05986.1 undecaprenyl/decaprenyl-phosphate alpha-N-acetylglucosaminyl 1-phosphate transferase [Solicola gregarius]
MREYLLVFVAAIGVTYLLGVAARELALRFNAVARVRDRDVHAIPIPYFGGIAMLGGLWAAYLVARHLPFLSLAPDEQVFDPALAVLVGGTCMCVVGVIDDLFELDPLSKFAGQVLSAVIVVAMGVQFLWIPLPRGGMQGIDPIQVIIFTVFWIVLTANAVNFIDGLDGLAVGVIAIGAGAFFIYAFILAVENNQPRAIAAALLSASLAGACVGMLPHNFFPARMFIGDSGSMLLGMVLACSAVTLVGQFPQTNVSQGIGDAQAGFQAALLPLLLPFAMLLVPLLDLVMAVVRRTRAGRSPFSPDKMHLHHRLLEIGHSQRRAVLVMYMVAALVAFGTVILSLFAGWQSVLGIAVLAVVTLGVAFLLPRWRQEPAP